jgi:hypothetical protein
MLDRVDGLGTMDGVAEEIRGVLDR